MDFFGIELRSVKNSRINVNGVAWVKNLCLDNDPVFWDFNTDTQTNLIDRYSQAMNFGVPYYRGKVITAWDTLRDFDN